MTRIEEIYATVLPEMDTNDIEDTVENRIVFLTGLQDAWKEDTDISVEKSMYQVALSTEIFVLKMRVLFPMLRDSQ